MLVELDVLNRDRAPSTPLMTAGTGPAKQMAAAVAGGGGGGIVHAECVLVLARVGHSMQGPREPYVGSWGGRRAQA